MKPGTLQVVYEPVDRLFPFHMAPLQPNEVNSSYPDTWEEFKKAIRAIDDLQIVSPYDEHFNTRKMLTLEDCNVARLALKLCQYFGAWVTTDAEDLLFFLHHYDTGVMVAGSNNWMAKRDSIVLETIDAALAQLNLYMVLDVVGKNRKTAYRFSDLGKRLLFLVWPQL